MFNVVAVAFMMLAEDKCDLHRLKLLGSMSFQALLGLNVVLFAVTKLGTIVIGRLNKVNYFMHNY